MRVPFQSEVGEIRGRDAIHLDSMTHTVPIDLCFIGELSAPLCSEYRGTERWLSYKFHFAGVLAYRCWELDLYPAELDINSSLDLVPDSEWCRALGLSDEIHYVVSTYDHIYEIIASEIRLEIGARVAEGATLDEGRQVK